MRAMRAVACAFVLLLAAACAPAPQAQPRAEGEFSVLPGSIGVVLHRADAGLTVVALRPGGPAARAGVRVGDVVRAYNGVPVRGLREFQRLMLDSPPGSEATLQLLRDGEERSIRVPIEEMDLSPSA